MTKQFNIFRLFRNTFFFLVLISLGLFLTCGNNSRTTGKLIPVKPEKDAGIVAADSLTADFAHRFWVEGGMWYNGRTPAQGGFYYALREDAGDSSRYWVGGYRFSTQEIVWGRVRALNASSLKKIELLSRKSVELRPSNSKMYIKLIFYAAEPKIRLEVNGVPMEAPFSGDYHRLRRLYFVSQKIAIDFEPAKQRGD